LISDGSLKNIPGDEGNRLFTTDFADLDRETPATDGA
jgi:hypothetical protein